MRPLDELVAPAVRQWRLLLRPVALFRYPDSGLLKRPLVRFAFAWNLAVETVAIAWTPTSDDIVIFATPQVGDLACDVEDLLSDAGDLGLPFPFGFEVELCRVGVNVECCAVMEMIRHGRNDHAVRLMVRIGKRRAFEATLVADGKRSTALLYRAMSRRSRTRQFLAALDHSGAGLAMTSTPHTSLHNTPQPAATVTSSRATENPRQKLVVGHPKHQADFEAVSPNGPVVRISTIS
ncbi:MAG: hypothetical protein R3D82_10555 [Xanthobacteraceae bacterium]